VNIINPLLADEVQRKHRERNGEAHPPHALNLSRASHPKALDDLSQSPGSATSAPNLGRLSTRAAQVVRAYWWVPAGFAALVLLGSIMGG
jgi:hypothetical protein